MANYNAKPRTTTRSAVAYGPNAPARKAHPMKDTASYFDVELTQEELRVLQLRIEDATRMTHLQVTFSLLRQAEREIESVLGFFPDHVPQAWCYIHVCRQLGLDYRSAARNTPKLPISEFVRAAKRAFPEFSSAPANELQRTVQVQRVHAAWVDWLDGNCARYGCTNDRHWLCEDKFEPRDYNSILAEVISYNASRPKLHLVSRQSRQVGGL